MPASRSPVGRSLWSNTRSLLVGQVGRLVVGAGYFLLATRTLGVGDFGVLVTLLAVTALIAPFSSLGATNLLVKHGSRDPAVIRLWLGSGLCITVLGAAVATVPLVLLGSWVLPADVSAEVVAVVVVSELVLGRVVELSAAVFVAQQRMEVTALMQFGLPFLRLSGVLAMLALPGAVDLLSWVVVLAVTSAVAAGVALRWAVRDVGRPRLTLAPLRPEWRAGLLFAVGLTAHTAHNDLDKVMLSRLTSPLHTGVYAAAYRFVDLAYSPVRALMGAAYPVIFRRAELGARALLPLLARLAVPALGYCVTAAVVVALAAERLVGLLGPGFADAAPVLTVLSLVLVLRCLHHLAADALTGLDLQGLRSAVQVGTTVLNLVLNAALIPPYGIWGAVGATLVCEVALALLLGGALLMAVRRDDASALPAAAQEGTS